MPLPMTVTVDLSQKDPNMFMDEPVVGPPAIQLLFCGGRSCQSQLSFVRWRPLYFCKAWCVCLCVPESHGCSSKSLLSNTEGEAFNRLLSGLLAFPHGINTFNWNMYSFFERIVPDDFWGNQHSWKCGHDRGSLILKKPTDEDS